MDFVGFFSEILAWKSLS